MSKQSTLPNETTSLLDSEKPVVNFVDGIPNCVDNRPLYADGSTIASVFSRLSAGTTFGAIKSLLNSNGIAHYPLTRHMGPDGRRGLKWSVLIDGKIVDQPIKLASIPDTATLRICNVRTCESFVNSKHPRNAPALTDDIAASKTAVSVPVETTLAPATQSTEPPATLDPETVPDVTVNVETTLETATQTEPVDENMVLDVMAELVAIASEPEMTGTVSDDGPTAESPAIETTVKPKRNKRKK